MILKRAYIKIAIVLLSGSLILACKKNDDNNNNNSAILEKLKGKWTVNNYTTNQYYSNSSHLTTISVNPGDYIEFSTDGKLYIRLFSSVDTLAYSIVPNNRIVFDYIDTFDIKTLTANQLVLTNKKADSEQSYYEQT
ncbi:MAG TPA: hypothetical protein VF540_03370, partial [Segetibacter sp.]